MSSIVNIDGLNVEITRKAVKRLNLKIKGPDGRVVMSIPYHATTAEVINFIRSKREWIDHSIAGVVANAEAHPEPGSKAEKERWRRELARRVAIMIPEIERRTGLSCNGWTIRDMHTRWGSCNTATHHINISLMLATRTDEELEYVIIHELVHTRVDNHGEKFKKYMDALCPNWRAIRRRLI